MGQEESTDEQDNQRGDGTKGAFSDERQEVNRKGKEEEDE